MLEKNEDLCYASLDMPTDKHRPGPKKKRQLNTDFSAYSEVSTGSNFNVEMLLSSVPVVHCCLHSLFISCCQHLFLCTWMINLVGLCCTLLIIVFFLLFVCLPSGQAHCFGNYWNCDFGLNLGFKFSPVFRIINHIVLFCLDCCADPTSEVWK